MYAIVWPDCKDKNNKSHLEETRVSPYELPAVLARLVFSRISRISRILVSKYHLYESFLVGRFEHVVQLQTRGGQLLFLRVVSSVKRSLFPRHIDKDPHPPQGHEEHPPRHRGDDQGHHVII